MKQIGFAILIAGATLGASAEEFGRVLSATPVVQQTATPRQICSVDKVWVPAQKSGAGAAVGAIAGGVVGSALGGGGRGNAGAALLGMVGGAIVGDRFEEASPSYVQDVQRCNVQNVMENRVVAYNVTYEFNGKQYTAQMPHDPGPTIALRLLPADTSATVQSAPVDTMTYVSPPVTVYPAPYYAAYRPPIHLFMRWGDDWGHGYRRGWH
jgi:uncharacterized protein YcfJ